MILVCALPWVINLINPIELRHEEFAVLFPTMKIFCSPEAILNKFSTLTQCYQCDIRTTYRIYSHIGRVFDTLFRAQK